MTTCKDLMTETVVTCVKEAPVAHVAQKMKAADIGCIPVVQSSAWQVVVGLITDRDIVLRVVSDKRSPDTSVGDVMSIPVITCHPDEDIEVAMEKMSKYQVRRIPIVDDDNMLVGIIAQADIARYMDTQSIANVVSGISEDIPIVV